MKKIIKIFFILVLGLSSVSCFKKVTEQEAREVLQTHLQNRYGESFEIGMMGIRSTGKEKWYEAEIMPSKYIGTPKEKDYYYKSVGTVGIYKDMWGEKLGTGGDIHFSVRLNEAAGEFYQEKLTELFGEMYLPVFEIDADKTQGNGKFLETLKFNRNSYFYIQGGIYLFGRVETLKDKEKYREKIFEFIQYMKKTKTFEYVDLAFYILDERCLTERFDSEIGPQLVDARMELKTADEFLEHRSKLLKELDDDFNKMTKEDKLNKINSFNRSNLRDVWGRKSKKMNQYSVIYHNVVYSRKYLEVELRLNEIKKLDYNISSDFKLLNTIKIEYKEYDEKKLDNNEWDGE